MIDFWNFKEFIEDFGQFPSARCYYKNILQRVGPLATLMGHSMLEGLKNKNFILGLSSVIHHKVKGCDESIPFKFLTLLTHNIIFVSHCPFQDQASFHENDER
jgi:hypothetical protein